MAKELGIDVDTVCRWGRDYRRAHGMPSYAEAKGIVRRELAGCKTANVPGCMGYRRTRVQSRKTAYWLGLRSLRIYICFLHKLTGNGDHLVHIESM